MPKMQTKISVKVTPNSGRNEVVGLANGVWRIKVAAPPDKGKANKELIEFLSETLGLKKDAIGILKGQTSHHKIVYIDGLTAEEAAARLSRSP
jgi:uncharacterized protein